VTEPMSRELTQQLAALSAEKRLLFERILSERRASKAPAAAPAPVLPATPHTAAFELASDADRRLLPAGVEDAYPLAMLQQGMLFHMEYESSSAVYHNVDSYHLRGSLDTSLLQRAVDIVVARHPILRTSFDLVSYSEPLQLVHRSAALPLDCEDLRHLPAAEQRAAIHAYVAAQRRCRFDLSRPPLLRLKIHRRSDDTYQLTLTEHHAILDGWSLQSTMAEIFGLHRALRHGELPVVGGPLPLTYRDFVALEILTRNSPVCQRFWADRLAGHQTLKLPRWPGRSTGGAPAAAHFLKFPITNRAELERLAERLGVPFKSLLFVAHAKVMSMLGGGRDVLTGLVANGRPEEKGGEQIRGLFLNTLPFRLILPGGTWKELIAASLRAETEILPFRRYPLPALQNEWGGGEELMETACSYAHFHVLRDIFGTGEVELIDEDSQVFDETHFTLIAFFQQYPHSSLLDLVLSCDASRVHGAQALLFGDYHRNVLAAMASHPEGRYDDTSFLTAPERHQFLVEWNDTAAGYPHASTLVELFTEQVRRAPEAEAVVFGFEQICYGELNRRANRLARHLCGLGVGPGDRVGLCLLRSADVPLALLAILKAGGAYVPLDPSYPRERLAFMAEDAGLAALVTTAELLPLLPAASMPIVLLDAHAQRIAARSSGDLEDRSVPESLAYVIYTSGSTGRPKGVAIPHRAVVRLVRNTNYIDLSPADRIAQASNISFDAATFEIWGALLSGACLVGVPREVHLSPADFAAHLAAQRISVLFLTPALFNQMALETPRAFASLRYLLLGGDALDPSSVRRVLALGPPERLLNGYGPTESTTFGAWHPITETSAEGLTIPIGRPLANTRLYVLDGDRLPAPAGVAGELYLGGDGLAWGYLGCPDLTAEKFLPDPFVDDPGSRLYSTGDRVRLLPDGAVLFLGRIDHQVKLRGFRIELGEIEAALISHPQVHQAVVLAREDRPGERRLVAYVVPAASASGPIALSCRGFLQQQLPDYMVPASFVVLAALPLTPNGKVDRRALPAPAGEQTAGAAAGAAPRTVAEGVLVEIWAKALGIAQLGVHDDFFALGGHSLLATRVMTRVRHSFRVELPLRALFEAPTVAQLALRIEEERRGGTATAFPPLVPVPRDRPLALSFAQQRLWFLDQLEPGSPLYNIPFALPLNGDLDRTALAATLTEIVRRHEALRTTFAAGEDEAVQIVHLPAPVPLPRIDLDALPAALRPDEARRLAEDVAQSPFDLARGPLLRVCLLRSGPEEHLLLLALHHIAGDGWSMVLLLREMTALYSALLRGLPSPLPELPVQYADFAAWQRAWLQGEVLRQEIDGWRRRLAGAPAVLELPVDRLRPAVQSFRGRYRQLALPAGLSSVLSALGRQAGTTSFMTLLAAFHLLLARWSDQEDICVGTPVAGRTVLEMENLIGLFVNTLIIRVDLAGAPPITELLDRVREAVLEAHAHQDVPLEKLVEAFASERSPAWSPLFQVMFTMQAVSLTGQTEDMAGLRLGPAQGIATQTAKFDLTLGLEETPWGLRGGIEYNTDLFDATTIQRLAGHFETLVAALTEDPSRRLLELTLLSAIERHQALVEWNDTTSDYPRESSLVELFAGQVRRAPEAEAVVFGFEQVCYGELNARANRLARHLRGLGVGPGDRVGLCLERSTAVPITLLGILKAGAAYVPLDPSYPPERLAFMAEDAGLTALVTTAELSPLLPATSLPTVLLDTHARKIAARSGKDLEDRTAPESLAYVIYTSGSTGRPKGIAIPHRAVVRLVRDTNYIDLSPADRIAQASNISFDAATFEIWGALLSGACLVGVPREVILSPDDFAALLAAQRIGVLFLTPALFNELAQATPRAFATLRCLLLGGDALDPRWLRRVLALGPPGRLLNGYGPTESTTFSTWHPISEASAEGLTVPIGRPLANTRQVVLDSHLVPVLAGAIGELFLGGDGLAWGYLGRPGLTAERFRPDPFAGEPGSRLYRTGDRVRLLPEGTVEFLGRLDDQVKLRGFRIELGEIEATLAVHPQVHQAVVLAREDEPGERRLVAYLVPVEGASKPLVAACRLFLQQRLPDYMVPAAFIVLAALPLTPNGKVDRRALPASEGEPDAATEAAPRTVAEELLAGIWAQALGITRLGVHDDFFALGGHSLLATRVMTRVRHSFRVDLALRALFEAPTVAQLALRIEEELRGGRAPSFPPLVPVPRDLPLPLSFAQQRLWFLDQLEPGSPLYNIPVALPLEGELDRPALAATLTEIVRRHEALRTTFADGEAEAVQVIIPPAAVPLPRIDLDALPAAIRAGEARRLVAAEANRPFDLARGPLLRVSLAHTGAGEHLLLLTLHHIVGDGWSMVLLLREMTALYRAFASGLPSPLPELPVQYADFAVWQRTWLHGELIREEIDGWRQRLAGAPAVLELPTDRPRRAVQRFRGHSLQFTLPARLSDALSALGRQAGTTPFMTLLAAFHLLLARWSGQEDISIGTPVAGRTMLEIEELIGLFVNTLIIRPDLAGAPTGTTLLERVREAVLEAHAHQDLPLEKLVEALAPERSLAWSPLFQVMFTMQAPSTSDMSMPGLRLAAVQGVATRTAKFDMSLGLEEGPQGLLGGIEYSTDLFDATTIQRLAGHFEVLVAALAEDPSRRLSELPIFSATERHQALVEWNDTASGYPRESTLVEIFAAQVRRAPEAEAVVFGSEQVCYRELNARANRLARHLRGLGVGPGDRVGLCLERSTEVPITLLGILKAGAAYVPLDPSYPPERLALMAEDARLGALVTTAELSPLLPAVSVPTVLLDADARKIAVYSSQDLEGQSCPESLAYLIYTSGSTGRPKGVAIPHRAVVRLVCNTNYIDIRPDDRIAQASNISFDTATFEIWGALLSGACLVEVPREVVLSPPDFAALLTAQRISVMALITALFHQMAREAPHALGALRYLLTGGEAIDLHWVRRVLAEAPPGRLLNAYGPSESTTISTWYPATEVPETALTIPIGRPLANTRQVVLDARLELVPAGAAGELYLGGDGLAWGYFGRPERTAEKFLPDPFTDEPGSRLYRTGDRVRLLPDGVVDFLGRIDHQVKLRSFRIELGEIDAALSAHPQVHHAVVLAREDEPGERRLVAYVVPAEGAAGPLAAACRSFLQKRLPDYMVPAAFVVLEALPLTPNGKVDRRALPAPELTQPAAGVAPRTVAEELLADIWAQALGIDRIGVHDDFFALGGHSLLATRVMTRVRHSFQVELPLRALFEAPTVAQLALRIEEERRGGAALSFPPLVPVPRDRSLPLSFAQQRLWFLDQLEPGSPQYNIPIALPLHGEIERPALAATLTEIVRRHEALRTTFAAGETDVVQIVHPPAPVLLPQIDLDGLPVAVRPGEARRLAEAVAGNPFDLARGPLLRLCLLRTGAEEHLLLLTLHHIVGDGWSMAVLLHEMTALYRAISCRLPSPLPELPVQYADFAVWQRTWLCDEVLSQEIDGWRQRLAGAPAVLELPADRPRRAVQRFRGHSLRFTLPARLSDDLSALSRQAGTTPFMTLLAAFHLLLARWSGQEDISVGTPVAGRTMLEIEELIGFFVNTLIIRADLAGAPQGTLLLERIREAVLEAHAHQDLPLEKLVEALAPERSLAWSPLFQVMFTMQAPSTGDMSMPGLRLGPVEGIGTRTAKFDLSLGLAEGPQGLLGEVEYSTDLFDATTIQRLAGHFETLVAALAEDPSRRLPELPILSATERHQLRAEWNDTFSGYPRLSTLVELFATPVRRAPEALAVVLGSAQVSYGELNARANRLARHLSALGVGPGDRVGLCLERSIEVPVTLLAILKAGAAYVPLDPSFPGERLAYMAEDAGLAALVTIAELLPLLPAVAVPTVLLDAHARQIAAHRGRDPEDPNVSESLAYVVYTSGSTGRPKGVAIPHRAVVRLVRNTNYLDFRSADRVAQVSNISFDAATFEIWGALLAGACLVEVPREVVLSPADFAALLAAQRVSVMVLITALFQEMAREALPALGALRVLVTGGEAIDPNWVRRVLTGAPPGRLLHVYGPSESTSISTWYPLTEVPETALTLPIGRPLANTRQFVLDARRELVPVGAAGELCLGGDGLAWGYLGCPDRTAEKFLPDPFTGEPGSRLYHTGDRVRLLPDGAVEFLGRIDQQVKLRGFRIELGEIETALLAEPSVGEAAVAIHRNASGDSRLIAYVVPAAGGDLAIPALRAALKERLPGYMIPSGFVLLPALPLTPVGKVDRRALPRPDLDADRATGEGAGEYVAPRDLRELRLAQIWQDVLGVAAVSVRDDFFSLGGHSLLATRIMALIRRDLGRDLPLAELFQAPTVEGLAALLRRQDEPRRREPLVAIQAQGTQPPLFCVHPVGGEVLVYSALARALGADQPFYGLQTPAQEAGATPGSIEEMATGYLEALRAVQPAGPYRLAGWSMGGVVAFEMARQLDRQGQKVALLALFDSAPHPPFGEDHPPTDLDLISLFAVDLWGIAGRNLEIPDRDLTGLGREELLALLFDQMSERHLLPPEVDVSSLRRSFEIFATNILAFERYKPKPYRGRLVLIQAAEKPEGLADPALAWRKLVRGGIECFESPGNHYTMVRSPGVANLAALLDSCFKRAREAPRPRKRKKSKKRSAA
jgi:amino acid adenylation domain-containing protein